jgi:hypothetical protein
VEDGGEDGVDEGKMVVRMAFKSGRVEERKIVVLMTLNSQWKMVGRMALKRGTWWCGWR